VSLTRIFKANPMKAYKKIGVLIIIILVVMQFIQPTKNISDGGLGENDISVVYAIPADLHNVFVTKCYDCHSNNTKYPWYFNIQPIGWWLAAHVHDGKEHLNFSEFKNYKPEKAHHKLEEIWEVTEDKSMPLKAYTLFHENSELTEADQKAIYNWLDSRNVKPE
jgi:hypothetical protein